MSNNVLYYPFIEVPTNAWFTRILLYWDTVGTIVPSEFTQRPDRLSTYMRSLLTEGLVTQVIPRDHYPHIQGFARSFLARAESRHRALELSGTDPRKLPTFRVHVEKLGDIGGSLQQMGLARRAEYPWYHIESGLASEYMASLAGVLSALPELDAQPITDRLSQFNLYRSPNSISNVVLEKILPSPPGSLTASDLARFKSKNARVLRRFRNRIQLFTLEASSVSDPHQRKRLVDAFITDTQDQVDEIIDAMRSQGWTRITLRRLLAYAATGTKLVDAIANGGVLSTIAASFGVARVVHDTLGERNIPTAFRGSFVVYAALAQRQYGRNSDKQQAGARTLHRRG